MQIKTKTILNLTEEEKFFLREASRLCANSKNCEDCPIHNICFDCFAEDISLSDFITEIIDASE